jgi:hypothetical protein
MQSTPLLGTFFQQEVHDWIDHLGRGGDRPSDHAALIADFDLTAFVERASATRFL